MPLGSVQRVSEVKDGQVQGARAAARLRIARSGCSCVAGGVAVGASAHRSSRLVGPTGSRGERQISHPRHRPAARPARQTFRRLRRTWRPASGPCSPIKQPLEASVRSSGGTVNHGFHTVNAFAATVSGAERTRLASDLIRRGGPPGHDFVKLPSVRAAAEVVRISPARYVVRCSAQVSGAGRQRGSAGLPRRPLQAAAGTRGARHHSRPAGPAAGHRCRRQGRLHRRRPGHQQPGLHPPRRLARVRRLPRLHRPGHQRADRRRRGVRRCLLDRRPGPGRL